MAEVTSGNVTVIVLTENESYALTNLLGNESFEDRLHGDLYELATALGVEA